MDQLIELTVREVLLLVFVLVDASLVIGTALEAVGRREYDGTNTQ